MTAILISVLALQVAIAPGKPAHGFSKDRRSVTTCWYPKEVVREFCVTHKR